MLQKLALAISPENEHRAIKDGAHVKRSEVSFYSRSFTGPSIAREQRKHLLRS